VDQVNAYNRREFKADAAALATRRFIDVSRAEQLAQAAHFGILCAQNPELELHYYTLQILSLCRTTKVAPEARTVFASFVEAGAQPQTEDPFVYATVEGDTLQGIAERFGTRLERLMRANQARLPRSRGLRPGLRLQIPDNRVYVAQAFDTFKSIAHELTQYVQCFARGARVTPEQLLRRNALLPDEPLRVGQALAFPFPDPD
jgi:LysM repeat protein